MNALAPERIHRNHRDQAPKFDPARQASTTPGKPALFHIVAQAQHAGRRLAASPSLQQCEGPASQRQPSPRGSICDGSRPDSQAGICTASFTAGIQHEGRAVEHQFVLSAELVDVDER